MNTAVCVDASVAAKWVLPEEYGDQALLLYENCHRQGTTVFAPPHLPIEVINTIRRRIARDLITHAEGQRLVNVFSGFSVRLVIPPDLYMEALDIAHRFNRPTVYDSHYVALAKILDCDLWTADESLINALRGQLPYVKWIAEYESG